MIWLQLHSRVLYNNENTDWQLNVSKEVILKHKVWKKQFAEKNK